MRLVGAGLREDIDYVELRTFWTLPNLITLVRFLLIPVFCLLVATGHPLWAFVTLVVVFSTDWVDGYVARRLNQISTVGKWLDPFADRLTLIIVSVTFVLFHVAPAWFVWAIVVPDVALAINSLILFHGSPELPVTLLGKLRTAVLMVAAPLLLLSEVDFPAAPVLGSVCTWVLLAGSVLHIAAAVHYFLLAHAKAARRRRAGEPTGGRAEPNDRVAA